MDGGREGGREGGVLVPEEGLSLEGSEEESLINVHQNCGASVDLFEGGREGGREGGGVDEKPVPPSVRPSLPRYLPRRE